MLSCKEMLQLFYVHHVLCVVYILIWSSNWIDANYHSQSFILLSSLLRKEMNVVYIVTIRYVGVIWFAFHILQLLPIRITQQNACCISKSTMKHLQITD